MSLLELRKKFLAVLLVSFMALGMAACSSTDDDAVEDEAAADPAAEQNCRDTYDTVDEVEKCIMDLPI
jgi:hypothetical protein